MLRVSLVKAPPETGCDKCPWPGACYMAAHRLVELSSTGEIVTNYCGPCLEAELGSWDQRGKPAPEASPPPKPVRPPATTLAGYHQWALGYASSGGRWTGISSDRTSDMEAREA